MNYVRHAKGGLSVVVATAVCHTLMSNGYGWAREAETDSGGTMFSGAFEFLLVTAASWVLMPLLLWAGMRLLRETGNLLLILVGGVAWLMVSGYFIDDIDRAGGHMPIPALVAYVLLGTALAGAGTTPTEGAGRST
ncbi:hypothetical protein [Streptomyces sp. NPDC056244]|uniref:hypothetical protein n=1 Tax=unclassified Streptomyces TaxID=2593676 RepID=UPI0035D6F8E2